MAMGAPANRRTTERRAAASMKALRRNRTTTETKVTPEKYVMPSVNQTIGGYKFAPLVASQQGRANQHESACFGLSSAWSFPSRSGIRLHLVAQPWFSLQRSIRINDLLTADGSSSSCCCCCCFSHSTYWLPTRKNYFTRWPIPLVVC